MTARIQPIANHGEAAAKTEVQEPQTKVEKRLSLAQVINFSAFFVPQSHFGMHHNLGDIHQPISIQTWLPGAEKIFYDIYKKLPANVKKKPDAQVAAECYREAVRLYPGRNGQQRWQRTTEAMLKKLPVLKERQGAAVGSREWRLSGAG